METLSEWWQLERLLRAQPAAHFDFMRGFMKSPWKAKAIIGLISILLNTGCIPSLSPLYTDADLLEDKRLEGRWKQTNGEDVLTFDRIGPKRYELSMVDEGVKVHFEARLVRLGKYLFVDLMPSRPEPAGDFHQWHFVRTHTFYKADLGPDFLELSGMHEEWLKGLSRQGKLNAAHRVVNHYSFNEAFLFICNTSELRRFVLQHAENTEAFRPKDAEEYRKE